MQDQDLLNIPLIVPVHAVDAALVISEKPFVRQNLPDKQHRLIFIREGSLQVQIGDDTFDLTQDQALIIRANQPFIRTHKESSLLRYYSMRFKTNRDFTHAGPGIDIPIISTLGRPDLVEHLFRLFLEEQYNKLDAERFAQLLFVQILSEVADGERWKTYTTSPFIPLVERAKAHIRDSYDKPISTSTIARAIDCSAGYLSRAFQRATGDTVTAFIHEVRLFRAKMLLTETNKSIAQIARECGFDNPSYFQRLFHRYENATPGNYRKLHSQIYTVTIE